MTNQLPQKYQEVAKALIPYTQETTSQQMAVINFQPALPCFICSGPAKIGLIAPVPSHTPGVGSHWLMFPICADCEERQVKAQAGEAE